MSRHPYWCLACGLVQRRKPKHEAADTGCLVSFPTLSLPILKSICSYHLLAWLSACTALLDLSELVERPTLFSCRYKIKHQDGMNLAAVFGHFEAAKAQVSCVIDGYTEPNELCCFEQAFVLLFSLRISPWSWQIFFLGFMPCRSSCLPACLPSRLFCCTLQLGLASYAVGQTTLEQIFNGFAATTDNPEIRLREAVGGDPNL